MTRPGTRDREGAGECMSLYEINGKMCVCNEGGAGSTQFTRGGGAIFFRSAESDSGDVPGVGAGRCGEKEFHRFLLTTLTIASLVGISIGVVPVLVLRRWCDLDLCLLFEGPSLAWIDVWCIRSENRILVECYAHTATQGIARVEFAIQQTRRGGGLVGECLRRHG